MKVMLLLALSAWAAPSSLNSVWQDANQAYKDGNYLRAAELYQQSLNASPHLWQALYNAGNAHYKAQNYADALDLYWKALEINPRPAALWQNLEMACQKTGDALTPPGVPFVLYRAWLGLTYGEWAALCLTLWWVFSFSLLILKFWPHLKFTKVFSRIALVSGVLSALSLAATLSHAAAGRHEWIILKRPGLLRSGPSESLPVTIQIPEGRRVNILDQKNGWIFIQTRKEKLQGWLR